MRTRFIFFAILIPGLFAINSQAQQSKITIHKIRVVGTVKADSGIVLVNSGLKPGKSITAEDLQKAIRNIWALHLFSDIDIYLDKQTPRGVDISIHVKEFPRLESWIVEGNKELKEKDFDKESGFYRGMIYTPFVGYKARKNIIQKYRDKGYLLAKVEIDTVHLAPDRVQVKFKVHEGKKVQVKRIRILGTKFLTQKELKKGFKGTKEKRWLRSGDFNPKKYKQDLERVIEIAHKKGFRDAEIVRDSLYYSPDKRQLFIDVYIDEGMRYYFGDITFEGNTVFSSKKLKSELLFAKGDVYNQELFEKSIRENLQNLYYNHGYLFANIQPREIPAGKDTVNIHIQINEGHVVRIKEIKITGNTKTNEKVVRRALKIYPGDIFNRDLLERSVREVFILNYFSNVVPDVKLIPGDDEHVNLTLKVEEKSTDTANMSAGYSQRDGMIGSLGMSLNNFSLKHPFSGGDGQKLSFNWTFGRFFKSVQLSFTEPWIFGTPTLAGFSVFNTTSGGGFYPWDRKEKGLTLQIGRRFRWPDNYFRGDWIFRFSDTRIFNVRDSDLLNQLTFFNRNTRQVSLTQIIQRDSRDRPEFPHRGSIYSLTTTLSGGPLQGEEDYLKNILNLEWFMPTTAGFVLYLQNRVGLISGLNAHAYVNPGELFYLGGSGLGFSESLRGYDDGTVGPLSRSGRPLGGRAMAKFTTELRFPIAPNPTIFGLFFAEAGNAWEDFNRADFFDLKRSAGFGFRVFMPLVGIIGVDFGYGFDHFDRFGERKGQWKVHFQFGRF